MSGDAWSRKVTIYEGPDESIEVPPDDPLVLIGALAEIERLGAALEASQTALRELIDATDPGPNANVRDGFWSQLSAARARARVASGGSE